MMSPNRRAPKRLIERYKNRYIEKYTDMHTERYKNIYTKKDIYTPIDKQIHYIHVD